MLLTGCKIFNLYIYIFLTKHIFIFIKNNKYLLLYKYLHILCKRLKDPKKQSNQQQKTLNKSHKILYIFIFKITIYIFILLDCLENSYLMRIRNS